MKDIYRVVLFGHRDFNGYRKIDQSLFELLTRIISEKKYVEIYIGHNGEFDVYAASIVKSVQRVLGKSNNELICILPYVNKNVEYYEKYYDRVEVFDCITKCHPKRAITQRNRWLVETCDLIICYIERRNGGAYEAVKHADKLNKEVINLAYLQ